MQYDIRKERFPIYMQAGYHTMTSGVSVGKAEPLSEEPIRALHYHQTVELGICVSGSGECHIEDHVYRFSKGDIQCTRANTAHLSKADKNGSCWIWVFINPFCLGFCRDAVFSDTLSKMASSGFCGVFKPDEHEKLCSLLRELIHTADKDIFDEAERSLIAGRIIVEMARIGNTDGIDNTHGGFDRLERAIMFIRENYMYSDKMTAERIAEESGFSVSHFRYLFKKHFGETIPQYINKTRLASASYLLLHTDKSITEIAIESGFDDISYFGRVFYKEFGMSPRCMRKANIK